MTALLILALLLIPATIVTVVKYSHKLREERIRKEAAKRAAQKPSGLLYELFRAMSKWST